MEFTLRRVVVRTEAAVGTVEQAVRLLQVPGKAVPDGGYNLLHRHRAGGMGKQLETGAGGRSGHSVHIHGGVKVTRTPGLVRSLGIMCGLVIHQSGREGDKVTICYGVHRPVSFI